MDIKKFVQRYPHFYHMAEPNSWPSIQTYGLLSTTAALDCHKFEGSQRVPYELEHRLEMMELSSGNAPLFVLRDQKPMPEDRLIRVLPKEITPKDWYQFLNKKVFLWATKARLLTLLNGKEYKNKEHDVLTISSESFVEEYGTIIELCHMNSGNTKPYFHNRNYEIFSSILDFPVTKTGRPVKEVAEVTIPYSIPNIAKHVLSVDRMVGPDIVTSIFKAT